MPFKYTYMKSNNHKYVNMHKLSAVVLSVNLLLLFSYRLNKKVSLNVCLTKYQKNYHNSSYLYKEAQTWKNNFDLAI